MGKYPYEKSCARCEKQFNVTDARVARNTYCSPQCASRAQRKSVRYTNCLRCDKPLTKDQRKFCSNSCSATYNNLRREYKKKPRIYAVCQYCGTSISRIDAKYCSSKCAGSARKIPDAAHQKRLNAQRQSKYRANDYRRAHPTANGEKIKQIYLNCPPGYEVDHIVPLSLGGLHHEDNLQYLTIEENRRKGNRWIG